MELEEFLRQFHRRDITDAVAGDLLGQPVNCLRDLDDEFVTTVRPMETGLGDRGAFIRALEHAYGGTMGLIGPRTS